MPDPTSDLPIRVGVLLVGLEHANLHALRFLVLQMNRLQNTFEYEFLPAPLTDPLLRLLRSPGLVSRKRIRDDIPGFVARYAKYLLEENAAYALRQEPPQRFIIVTMLRLDDDFYTSRRWPVGVLALGDWGRYMAPPSILEFILTLVVRESVALASRALAGSIHFGTKGCLFDFTPNLDEVRQKVLGGFVCAYCTRTLVQDGFPHLPDELRTVLKKDWLGQSDDSHSPAGIIEKLGYDLFTTKGLRTTTAEKIMATLRDEGVKGVLALVGSIAGAFLLLKLGLKVK